MAEPFLGPDFLLPNESARRLYREYAADQPIFDYHCHLPVQEIADNRDFPTITEIWLGGDHYKWRAMRALGIDERLITGDAGDYEKFSAWAEAVPYTVRNPLYHWTHMELRRPFEVDELLSPRTAEAIYHACNERLRQPELRTHGLLRMMNVRVVCTTDDPADSLEHHERIRTAGAPCTVVPGFRADHALAVDDPERLNGWLAGLGERVGREITDYDGMLAALAERHADFHAAGCRLSDHGLEVLDAEPYTAREVEGDVPRRRAGPGGRPGRGPEVPLGRPPRDGVPGRGCRLGAAIPPGGAAQHQSARLPGAGTRFRLRLDRRPAVGAVDGAVLRPAGAGRQAGQDGPVQPGPGAERPVRGHDRQFPGGRRARPHAVRDRVVVQRPDRRHDEARWKRCPTAAC